MKVTSFAALLLPALAAAASFGMQPASAVTQELSLRALLQAPASEDPLIAAGIIPRVIPSLTPGSQVTLSLSYNGSVVDGVLLAPPQAAEQPEITITGADPDALYTLVVIDPDAPDPANPIRANILHGIITNIPGGNVAEGDVVTPYRGPNPPIGVHRYIFLLYVQPGTEPLTLQDPSTGPNGRASFNVLRFAEENGLGLPVAASFFNSAK